MFSKALKVFKVSRRDEADSKTPDRDSSNQSISSDSSDSSGGKRRKWSLPSKVIDFFRKSSVKPDKKNQHQKRQLRDSQPIKEDFEEIDSVQENKTQSQPEESTQPEQQEKLQQQHKELPQQQQEQKQQEMPQKYHKEQPQQLQQQQKQKKQLPQLSVVQKQQPYRLQPQPQRRQLQPQQQVQLQPYCQQQLQPKQQLTPQQRPQQQYEQQQQRQYQPQQHLRQFEQRKLQQQEQQREIKRQLQPRLAKQAQRPFKRLAQWEEIIISQEFILPSQDESRPQQPKQRLLPQTGHYSYTISKRDLELTDCQIVFEGKSIPQMGQIMGKRQCIVETPRGPQRASEIQYADIRLPAKFSYAPRFSIKDLEFSLPLRQTKSNQNSPIKFPQGEQRRSSLSEFQQMNQSYEDPKHARLSSKSQSIVGHSQDPSQYMAGPSRGLVQNYSRSSQYLSGPAQGKPKNLSRSSQYIAGPSQRPSQSYGYSTPKIVGPSQGPSIRFTSSSQSIVNPSQGSLKNSHSSAHSSQSISGSSLGSPQHCTGKLQCPAGSSQCHSQNYTNLSQDVAGPSRGSSQHCTGMTQCVSGSFQCHSQNNTHLSQSMSGPSQCSSQSTIGTSQCIADSQCDTQNDNDPWQNVEGSSQNDNGLSQNITDSSQGSLENYPSSLQSTVSPSQDLSKKVTKSIESLTHSAESSLSVPGPSQGTVGQAKSVANSAKSVDDSNGSKSAEEPSISTAGPSTSNANRSENVPISQDPFLNIAGPSNAPHLVSSYSQLVSTLSKQIPNQVQNLVIPSPEQVESQEESPSESPIQDSGPLAILARTIPRAAAVITKMKNSASSLRSSMNRENMVSRPLEYNPIMKNYEIQKEVGSAGPGLIWRIHDAVSNVDEKECSVFIFDKRVVEKLYHSKSKEPMLNHIRASIQELAELNHPRLLNVLCPPVESRHTIAFATERVYASLHNILAWTESSPIDPNKPYPVIPTHNDLTPPIVASSSTGNVTRPPFAREYIFDDAEVRYGFHQLSEALQFMHRHMRKMHRNVCPSNILVTKRGLWKLFGFEFAECIPSDDPMEFLPVPQWSYKISRFCQPQLDYMAPETQLLGMASTLGDMYSMGMVLAAVYNQGRPLINSNNSSTIYMRQMDELDLNVAYLVSIAPNCLHEALPRLLERDPQNRPTPQLLTIMRYFRCSHDPSVQALEALEANIRKSISQRCEYYVRKLPASLPYIPKKLRWQNVWPVLELEFKVPDVISSVLRPVFWFVNNCTSEEYHDIIYPTIRKLIYSQRLIPVTVVLLENLHILTKKSSEEILIDDLLPMLFQSLNCNLYQMQIATLIAIQNVSDIIPDKDLRDTVIVKVKNLVNKNVGDVKIINFVLGIYEKNLSRLDNTSVLTHVVPTMQNMRLGNSDVIDRFVRLYRAIFTEEKFDLSCELMATEMIPKLAPHVINSNLNVDQFNNIIEILYDLLESVEKIQREKLKAEGALSPGSNRRNIRLLKSNNNVPAPPFSIPNLRVEKSKTSGVVDIAQKNTEATVPAVNATASAAGSISALKTKIEQWVFGFGNSTNDDSKFLRVTSVLPNRRQSDNTLMTPKIRIVPSCSSSPGGTPGPAGLPIRRHSNIGPQERRLSSANLLPPTNARHPRGRGSGSSLSVPSTSKVRVGSVPNTSSSVPFLGTNSPSSLRASHVTSECHNRERRGSDYLAHIVRLFPNKSASNSPHSKRQNTENQRSSTSIYAAVRHSTNLFIRRCSSLNVFMQRLPS